VQPVPRRKLRAARSAGDLLPLSSKPVDDKRAALVGGHVIRANRLCSIAAPLALAPLDQRHRSGILTEPSSPALRAIWRAGALITLRTISTPTFWSSFWTFSFSSTLVARKRATPPPGRMGKHGCGGGTVNRLARDEVLEGLGTASASACFPERTQ
jgi:hypothetical protein